MSAREVVLHVPATVREGELALREVLGEATCEDGRRVEVAVAGAAVLVTVSPVGPMGWRTYRLELEALCATVLGAESADAEDITDEQIAALSAEAAEASDVEQVELCRRALEGNADARAACAAARAACAAARASARGARE